MKRIKWGDDPRFWGPRDWFRNSLLIGEILRRKSKGKILDFGCGSGNLLIRIVKLGFVGTGIDASNLSSSYLKKKIESEGMQTKIKVIVGKENSLKRLTEKFDVVVCGEVLEHIKNDEYVVRNFYNILKKGGICVVSVPAHRWMWSSVDVYAGHFRRYEKHDLKKLFERQGFRIERVYYWGFPLGLFWDMLVLYPLFRNKGKKKISYTNSSGILTRLINMERLKIYLSCAFWFDTLFNWTSLGIGLVLVAEK